MKKKKNNKKRNKAEDSLYSTFNVSDERGKELSGMLCDLSNISDSWKSVYDKINKMEFNNNDEHKLMYAMLGGALVMISMQTDRSLENTPFQLWGEEKEEIVLSFPIRVWIDTNIKDEIIQSMDTYNRYDYSISGQVMTVQSIDTLNVLTKNFSENNHYMILNSKQIDK